ncbi:MAG TPA: gamma carbonic anhydrase family protein [Thermodesulfobacteriota bacterium]|nr:gamma carbonic anhydrase family protein [Thermodesulfobacteriota bacterium]
MLLPYKGKRPKLHETVYVEASARIIGDVIIGAYASVWFNAVVRGDVNYIRIGERTNVQDNSVLHVTKDVYPLIIGSDVTIGHNAVLHGCIVKDRCLIGMGSIILDDAEIGEDTIVGAGALVTEGTKVPPGSLILGAPARVVRKLSGEEVEGILTAAKNYLEYTQNYIKERRG